MTFPRLLIDFPKSQYDNFIYQHIHQIQNELNNNLQKKLNFKNTWYSVLHIFHKLHF